MRAAVPELETPHPLGIALPAVFHEDEMVQRFLSAFDIVMAPIFCTLDNIDSYFDPMLSPPDFLEWVGSWLGVAFDDNWPLERCRSIVGQAATLYRWRGTVKGLAAELALHTGFEPEIEESGGIVWSSRPGGPIPGTSASHVRVVLRVPDPSALNMDKLHAIIGSCVPADVTHELEVVQA